MADGGWPGGTGGARTLVAIDQLRVVLQLLESRLAAMRPGVLPSEEAAELIHALEVLSRRVVDQELAARRRADDLAEALGRLARRLEAQGSAQAAREQALSVRLDLMLGDLGRRREAVAVAPPVREPGLLRLILAAASAAAALSVVGAGVLVAARPQLLPPFVSAALEDLSFRGPVKPQGPTAASATRPTAPLAHVAPVRGETYAAVAQALARGEALALARLNGLARAGDAAAQLHLASLYETGTEGLERDVAAARLWTGRAAQGGDRMAMHNLALFMMRGEGGPLDLPGAAGWFRAAAERGVVDSQYNLGLLYEAGRGAPRNLREAYRWFSIAANAGDVAARERQVEIEGRLQPAERASLDDETGAFQPGAQAQAPSQVIPPASTLAETQVLLARQGYYLGPADGVASPAFAAAVAAWRRDHP